MRTRQLSFTNRDSTSYSRARENGIVIRPHGRFTYRVRLTDSADQHVCYLAQDRGSYAGNCDCLGYEYHENVCAHLWAIYLSAEMGVVEIPDAMEALTDGPMCPHCGHDLDPRNT